MKDPRLAAALIAKIGALCPQLLDKVYPFDAPPPSLGPYATYAFIDRVPVKSLRGLSALTMRRVQVDIWDQDDERGSKNAFMLQGRRDVPGLDQFCGMLAFPAVAGFSAGELAVEYVECSSPTEAIEPAIDGSERGWNRYSADYLITYIEG